MKLTIVAATGGIGRQLLDQALAAGHDVTALVRNPGKLPAGTAGLASVQADLATAAPEDLEPALRGVDAVLSGLGARTQTEAGVAHHGTRALVAAMKEADVRRLVVVSAAPLGTVPSPARPHPPKHDPGDGFLMRQLFSRVARTAFRRQYADLALMEDVVRESGLDWTIERPPKLTDKPLTGRYRTEFGRNPRGAWSIPRADVAHHMLRVLDQPATIQQIIGLAT